MIHLYALTRGTVPSVRGIADSTVTTETVDDLCAVVSYHDHPPPGTAQTALVHVGVIDALGEHGDVLPVRFGRGHRDLASLRGKLEPELPDLRSRLDEVGGHVEFVARVAGSSRGETPRRIHTSPRSGRAYLEERRAQSHVAAQERQAEGDRLREVTRPLALHATSTVDTSGKRGPERCFLVPKDAAKAFEDCAERLAAGPEGIVIGGPWAPFTFAAIPRLAKAIG